MKPSTSYSRRMKIIRGMKIIKRALLEYESESGVDGPEFKWARSTFIALRAAYNESIRKHKTIKRPEEMAEIAEEEEESS